MRSPTPTSCAVTSSPAAAGSASPPRSGRRPSAAAAPAPMPRRRSGPPEPAGEKLGDFVRTDRTKSPYFRAAGPMTTDPFDLQRFRAAQEQGGSYTTALAE